MNEVTEKMADYFNELREQQRAEKVRKEQLLQQAKDAPLTTVLNFISAKNDGGKGMTAELKEFYQSATPADIESYVDAAEAENIHIITLTEDERFIHQKAAESYDAAMKKQLEIDEARTQLANFRQKVKVTLFDGSPVPEVEKPDEKPVAKDGLQITIVEAE